MPLTGFLRGVDTTESGSYKMNERLINESTPTCFQRLAGHLRYHFRKRTFEAFVSDLRDLGTSAAATLLFSPVLRRHRPISSSTPPTIRRVRLRGYRYPFFYRENTSDAAVIRQVLGTQEYECVGHASDVSFILDCGANIGCTSFYFLNRYPNARLIAVEPDSENAQLCRRNLRPFGGRALVIQAGLWSEVVPLRVERGGYTWWLQRWARVVLPSSSMPGR
jgi:hypothetical protein